MANFLLIIGVSLAAVALCLGQEETCGENMIYMSCGTACPNYCNRDDKTPIACTLQCVPGCQCAPGYVKEAIDSDTCVLQRACKRVQRCPRNKAFYTCGTACPKYCGRPEVVDCTKNCVQECQCLPGYVLRNENSNDCIEESQCT